MRKYTVLIILFTALFSVLASSPATAMSKPVEPEGRPGSGSESLNPKDKIKMQQARNEFLNFNYRGALNIYREILKDNRNNANVNYRIAECYLAIKRYELAIEYFQNAKRIDPGVNDELYLKYGLSLHRNGLLDDALDAFNTFKKFSKKRDIKKTKVNRYIEQIKLAQHFTANPEDVDITNVGREVNSRYGDYAPSLTADGKTLIFTSRRSSTEGGNIDKEGDHKYFEDILISHWDPRNEKWSRAEGIPGRLNSEGHDASLCISADGEHIYIYRNDGSLYIGDIFVSNKTSSGKWGTPRPLGKTINSSYFESSASISSDGKMLYFISERPKGGYGQGDIWVSEKISRTEWGEPENLGKAINTEFDEVWVSLHPDGKRLFFSSDGHNSMGGYDIFMSEKDTAGNWSDPVNLGFPVNTVDDDLHFTLTADNKTAYYSTVRKDGFGERDIYKIDLSNHPVIKGKKTADISILKGSVRDEKDNWVENEITITVIDTKSGKEVASAITNESGGFFFALPGDKLYKLKVEGETIASNELDVKLPIGESGTHVMIKDIKVQVKE